MSQEMGAAGITITLDHGEIQITHATDGDVLAYKPKPELGDWDKLIEVLKGYGFKWVAS